MYHITSVKKGIYQGKDAVIINVKFDTKPTDKDLQEIIAKATKVSKEHFSSLGAVLEEPVIKKSSEHTYEIIFHSNKSKKEKEKEKDWKIDALAKKILFDFKQEKAK